MVPGRPVHPLGSFVAFRRRWRRSACIQNRKRARRDSERDGGPAVNGQASTTRCRMATATIAFFSGGVVRVSLVFLHRHHRSHRNCIERQLHHVKTRKEMHERDGPLTVDQPKSKRRREERPATPPQQSEPPLFLLPASSRCKFRDSYEMHWGASGTHLSGRPTGTARPMCALKRHGIMAKMKTRCYRTLVRCTSLATCSCLSSYRW